MTPLTIKARADTFTLRQLPDGAAAQEAVKAERAIVEFLALADRLDALAAQRRPWWRRLVG
jgi:hypothetical protein